MFQRKIAIQSVSDCKSVVDSIIYYIVHVSQRMHDTFALKLSYTVSINCIQKTKFFAFRSSAKYKCR